MSFARPAVLGDVDANGVEFDLIPYRGRIVASLNGWIADVKSRGGVVTQIPGGFFEGIKGARFGSSVPYVYELPPVWLLVSDGIDTAAYEFLDFFHYTDVAEAADNQMQGLVDMIDTAGTVVGGIPSTLKVVAIGAVALLGIMALSYLPRPRSS